MSSPCERQVWVSSSTETGPKCTAGVHAARTLTHRLDEQGPHLLLGMPCLHTVPHLLQELLMVFQKLRDLVEDLIHQRWVTQQGVLRLLQWLHVALEDPQDQCVFLQRWHPHLTCTVFLQCLQLSSGKKIPSPRMVFLPSPGLTRGRGHRERMPDARKDLEGSKKMGGWGAFQETNRYFVDNHHMLGLEQERPKR